MKRLRANLNSVALWALSVLLLAAIGCSGPVDERPKTAKVRGKVTYNGKPVEGAVVSFVSDDVPRAATGKTDANGEFTLTTYEPGDGAIIGTYKVAITKPAGEAAADDAGYDPDNPNPQYEKQMEKTEPAGKSEIPAKYADPKTSGLTATVEDKEENYFEFNLTD